MTAKTIFIGIHCFIDSYVYLQKARKAIGIIKLEQQKDRWCPFAVSIPYILITKYSLITNYKTGLFSIFENDKRRNFKKSRQLLKDRHLSPPIKTPVF